MNKAGELYEEQPKADHFAAGTGNDFALDADL